jgi:hypothetical protein
MRALARALVPLTAFGCLLGPASEAGAELVYLTSGRTLSVRSHRIDGAQATLLLRAGGEVACPASLIARIEPDEVPWPEPAPAGPAAPESSATATAMPFDDLIGPLSLRHGVEPALVRAVIETESAFEPRAMSPKGAMGLMQLMPRTARQYAVGDPFDPSANLDAGIRHLRGLLDRYDVRLALAAYNAGEGTIRRHGGVPPFRETRDYVERVLRRAEHFRRVAEPPGAVGSHAAPPLPASPSS